MGCGASRSEESQATSPKNQTHPSTSSQPPPQFIFNQPQVTSIPLISSSSLAPIASAQQLNTGASVYPYKPHHVSTLNSHKDSTHQTFNLSRPEEQTPEPAILFEDERPQLDKQLKKLDNLPKYVSQNCSSNAKWLYLKHDIEELLPQDVQILIERSYVRGDPMVFFELNGVPTEFNYGEGVIGVSSNGDISVYPAVRTALTAEPYYRMTEDGTMRPFPKELQDAVRLSGGEMVFILDNRPYQIVTSSNSLVDLKNGVSLKLSVTK